MFVALAGLELELGTVTTTAPTPQVPLDAHFLALAPAFVQVLQDLVQELTADASFCPVVRGAAVTLGRPVDRHGVAILHAFAAGGGVFRVLCGLLYRRGRGLADRLCIPAGGGLRTQVLRECHDGPLGGQFGWAITGSLVCRLAFWVGQDRDVVEHVRMCQTCQRLKAERPSRAAPPPASPLPAGLYDWGGMDRRARQAGPT
jgi:hypothetical protein